MYANVWQSAPTRTTMIPLEFVCLASVLAATAPHSQPAQPVWAVFTSTTRAASTHQTAPQEPTLKIRQIDAKRVSRLAKHASTIRDQLAYRVGAGISTLRLIIPVFSYVRIPTSIIQERVMGACRPAVLVVQSTFARGAWWTIWIAPLEDASVAARAQPAPTPTRLRWSVQPVPLAALPALQAPTAQVAIAPSTYFITSNAFLHALTRPTKSEWPAKIVQLLATTASEVRPPARLAWLPWSSSAALVRLTALKNTLTHRVVVPHAFLNARPVPMPHLAVAAPQEAFSITIIAKVAVPQERIKIAQPTLAWTARSAAVHARGHQPTALLVLLELSSTMDYAKVAVLPTISPSTQSVSPAVTAWIAAARRPACSA